MRSFRFPLYVRLDDGSVTRIESMDRILCHLEPIDIENDEYLFWDADANGVKVLLTGKVGVFHNPHVSGLCASDNAVSLQDAMKQWANQLGVNVDSNGTPAEVWDRLQQAQPSPPPSSFVVVGQHG